MTPAWNARQLLMAWGADEAARFSVRNRDAIYGETFRCSVAAVKVQEVSTAPRLPWQSAYAERVTVSIRRESLNNLNVMGEQALQAFARELCRLSQ